MKKLKTRAEYAKRLQAIANQIDYPKRPGLFFLIDAESYYDKRAGYKPPFAEKGLVLWIEDWVINVNTGKSGRQVGRRWAVDPTLDEDSLVRLAFQALLAFEEHETREFFTFKGKRVCDPHKRFMA